MSGTIVWFRNDLRLHDNPALFAAAERGAPVIPLFLLADSEEDEWALGGASRWWLHHSLQALDQSLREHLSRLVLRKTSDSLQELLKIAEEVEADAVVWNRRYEPASIARDTHIKESLAKKNITASSYNGSLLIEPWKLSNQSGKPFQVFTPFWKAHLNQPPPRPPLPVPRKFSEPKRWPTSTPLKNLELEPTIDWAGGLQKTWKPGEAGARAALKTFVSRKLDDYSHERDRPDHEGTSQLSPHLHFGEISPRAVWHATVGYRSASAETFRREIGWREFAHHLLFHFPKTPHQALRSEFNAFPWKRDKQSLARWQKGMTGYPIIDAGMRQLWHTGWMHNRVRMIVASFLVKDLLLSWKEGAEWFWDTLVDADLANNTLGWQWAGGCGADAAPYFRVFNPVLQGEKFDPDGTYVRHWIPELKNAPAAWIHKPWQISPEELKEAGIILGKTYPAPIVDHAHARDQALIAFKSLRKGAIA